MLMAGSFKSFRANIWTLEGKNDAVEETGKLALNLVYDDLQSVSCLPTETKG